MSYSVVFHNDDFIIVDKKPKVLSVPGRLGSEEDSRIVLGKVLELDFNVPIFPVHRLDFEVSGLILYAKNQMAHKMGNKWFEQKQIQKTYRALTSPIHNNFSVVVGETYEWRCRLLRGKKRAYESPHGKDSLTLATCLFVKDEVFHWDLSPITGRSHQLRFELFRHGHPILGDVLYSSNKEFNGINSGGIALRSYKMNFSKCIDYKKFNLPDELVLPV